jgi:hypothetical protein
VCSLVAKCPVGSIETNAGLAKMLKAHALMYCEVLLRAHWSFEDQNKVTVSSRIIALL